MAILDIDTIIVQTRDMNRSVAFFRDVLGLELQSESPYWSSFKLGQHRLGVHPAMNEAVNQIQAGCIVGLATDDLAGLRAQLEGALAGFIGEYHQTPSGVVLDFSDPDHNSFQAIQPGTKMDDFSG